MKNLQVLAISIFLFLSILTITSTNVNAQETITVGPGGPPLYGFSKITDAITYANESDIINVYSGTYTENIVINKPITLNGDGSGSTIIVSANSKKNTIEITADFVNISGFTIKNLGGTYACVWLNAADNCQIFNNYIENGENSIYLINSNNNIITENTIENNKNGIYLWTSINNTIKNNNIQKNDIYGVFISSFSSGNTVYLNDFSNNYGSNSRDDGHNNWDYEELGNYWDDYNDYDTNKDGIGDNPYLIYGSGGNQDNFPLGDFLSISQPIAYIDSISPNPAPKGQTVSFIGHGTTPDGIIEVYEWKVDNIFISGSASFSISALSSGTHSISFRVKNDKGIWSEKVYKTLSINPNQKPIAFILKPSGSAEFGTPINFTGYGVDPDGEIKAYSWRSIPSFISSTDASFIISNLPINNYTIYFKVKDNEGDWSTEVSSLLTILPNTTASNNPPIANADGPYFGLVNQNITFNGSLSFDPNQEDMLFYFWDFGDETTGEGVVIEHMYKSVGNYSVELTLTDEHGAHSKNKTYVIVNLTTNDQDEENKGIPGFEIIFVIIIMLFMVIIRKINNKKRRF